MPAPAYGQAGRRSSPKVGEVPVRAEGYEAQIKQKTNSRALHYLWIKQAVAREYSNKFGIPLALHYLWIK